MTQINPVTAVARLIRFYPPNPTDSQSILRLRKNGTDAETCAECCVSNRADLRAGVYVEKAMMQINLQQSVQMICRFLFPAQDVELPGTADRWLAGLLLYLFIFFV